MNGRMETRERRDEVKNARDTVGTRFIASAAIYRPISPLQSKIILGDKSGPYGISRIFDRMIQSVPLRMGTPGVK